MDADEWSIGALARTTMRSTSLVKRLAWKMAKLFADSSTTNGHQDIVFPAPIIREQKNIGVRRPDLSRLRKATRAEVQQIADSRRIDCRAVELAQDLGTLRVGEVCGYLSWVLLDASGLCAEGRRLNRRPYPEIAYDKIQLGERKAHTLRGSRKDWPVGILPAKEYRHCVEALLLIEGVSYRWRWAALSLGG
jgi:hypothetical protein